MSTASGLFCEDASMLAPEGRKESLSHSSVGLPRPHRTHHTLYTPHNPRHKSHTTQSTHHTYHTIHTPHTLHSTPLTTQSTHHTHSTYFTPHNSQHKPHNPNIPQSARSTQSTYHTLHTPNTTYHTLPHNLHTFSTHTTYHTLKVTHSTYKLHHPPHKTPHNTNHTLHTSQTILHTYTFSTHPTYHTLHHTAHTSLHTPSPLIPHNNAPHKLLTHHLPTSHLPESPVGFRLAFYWPSQKKDQCLQLRAQKERGGGRGTYVSFVDLQNKSGQKRCSRRIGLYVLRVWLTEVQGWNIGWLMWLRTGLRWALSTQSRTEVAGPLTVHLTLSEVLRHCALLGVKLRASHIQAHPATTWAPMERAVGRYRSTDSGPLGPRRVSDRPLCGS